MKAALIGKARGFRTFRGVFLCMMAYGVYAVPASSQTQFPEGKGKETVETVCSQCHGLKQVATSKLTHKEWENMVYDMVARGAPLLEDEMETVIEYLAKSFPKEGTTGATAGKVNVNKATAKELETALAISDQEAGAVVQYREQNGNFTKWEDLQKVPGLDAKKVEGKKDILTF